MIMYSMCTIRHKITAQMWKDMAVTVSLKQLKQWKCVGFGDFSIRKQVSFWVFFRCEFRLLPGNHNAIQKLSVKTSSPSNNFAGAN